jgi:SAM-dependent methyltransferase
MICEICHRNWGCVPSGLQPCTGDQRQQCIDNPKINVGSGEMLKSEMINFDCECHSRRGLSTDVLGQIEDIDKIFPKDFAQEILCAHVIEHFYRTDAINILGKFHRILRPGGKLVIEAPCLAGVYWHHITNGHGGYPELANSLYGNEPHRLKWGSHWMHKSGWTGEMMEAELKKLGMGVIHIGPGRTHGMGARDFRVEAVKNQ